VREAQERRRRGSGISENWGPMGPVGPRSKRDRNFWNVPHLSRRFLERAETQRTAIGREATRSVAADAIWAGGPKNGDLRSLDWLAVDVAGLVASCECRLCIQSPARCILSSLSSGPPARYRGLITGAYPA